MNELDKTIFQHLREMLDDKRIYYGEYHFLVESAKKSINNAVSMLRDGVGQGSIYGDTCEPIVNQDFNWMKDILK